MKNIIPILLSLCILLSGCSYINDEHATEKVKYKKAIWITYYELSDFTMNSTKDSFTLKIDDVFKNLSKVGFNTVVVQVRPCCDAFYCSSYFPSSQYFNGKQGSVMSYDPLSIMCDISRKYGLSIEAWINPYRVSQDDDYSKLVKNNFAIVNKDMTRVVNKKIYLNPAYDEVINLICNGVKEIVENYEISAIHFDDYFYPTTDKSFDKKEYKGYKGDLSLNDWRRNNVNRMIEKVHKTIKETNSNIEFGVSPAANIENNKNILYADVEYWIKNDWIDYVCPQIYFGFKNEVQPFMQTVKEWLTMTGKYNVDLYIGLPLYKTGNKDEYASINNKKAINEFKKNNNIISRQISYISNFEKIKGYFVFSYSQLNSEKSKEEVSNMINIMQSNNPQ